MPNVWEWTRWNCGGKTCVPGNATWYNDQVIDASPARACMERALQLLAESKSVPPVPGKKRGVGIANMIYPHDASSPSSATLVLVKIDGDGSAVLYNGLSDVGQGSKTALCQIAAETLGIPPEKITFVNGDPRITSYDEGTGAFRTIFICGRCLQEACEKAREQLFVAAGKLLGVQDPRKYTIRDGVIFLKTFPELHVTVAETASWTADCRLRHVFHLHHADAPGRWTRAAL